jgi:hypothetical protein
MRFVKWFVQYILRPEWVVFYTSHEHRQLGAKPELGLRIFGIIIGLHKGKELYYTNYVGVRLPGKREFGESLYPVTETKENAIEILTKSNPLDAPCNWEDADDIAFAVKRFLIQRLNDQTEQKLYLG